MRPGKDHRARTHEAARDSRATSGDAARDSRATTHGPARDSRATAREAIRDSRASAREVARGRQATTSATTRATAMTIPRRPWTATTARQARCATTWGARASIYAQVIASVSDEMNPFALVGRRQAAAAAAAYHARAGQLDAGIRTRAQDRAALERADRLATQQARQFDPFRALDTRTSFHKFGRHCKTPYRPLTGLAVRHLPTVPRTLVPGQFGNTLARCAVNGFWVRLGRRHGACCAARPSTKGRLITRL
jgi:hypothetical protein